MNKIGIIGYGKMGKEIFRFYYPQCKNTAFSIYCRHDKEQHKAELDKELQKMLRRKRITEEVFAFQQENLRFTDDWQDLSGCDMIIESASEDLDAKRSIFASLEKIVSPDCLFLTNTSSLAIDKIFEDIAEKERCFGLHFFYPLKLTSFAELNLLPENDPDSVERVKNWVEAHGKRALEFYAPYHMYLNQFMFTAISAAVYFRNECGCSVDSLEAALRKFFPIGGIFGLINSIGLGLLTKSADSFRMERTISLHNYGMDMMKNWVDSGFSELPDTFMEAVKEAEKNIPEKEIAFPVEVIIALLMNEAIYAAEEYKNGSELLFEALQDTMGTGGTFADYYKEFGAERLSYLAKKLHEYEPKLFSSANSEDKWKKYFEKG